MKFKLNVETQEMKWDTTFINITFGYWPKLLSCKKSVEKKVSNNK